MQQLHFDFTTMGTTTRRKPVNTRPAHVKPPRPEHKPYEPNYNNDALYNERGVHFFTLQGAYFDELYVRSAFLRFLEQPSKDPKLQKAREFKWENSVSKIPAYHWREYENGVSYSYWTGMYDKHLIGYTDNHWENYQWERDYITSVIEDGVTAWDNCTHAFFDTLRKFQHNISSIAFTGRDLDNAWESVKRREWLNYTERR